MGRLVKKIKGIKGAGNKKPKSTKKPQKGELSSQIKTAGELGLSARNLGVIRKPTTHKGKKYLQNREPKTVENDKKSVFLKGSKSSVTVNTCMRDLHGMRGNDLSKLLTKKSNEIQPFDDPGTVE